MGRLLENPPRKPQFAAGAQRDEGRDSQTDPIHFISRSEECGD